MLTHYAVGCLVGLVLGGSIVGPIAYALGFSRARVTIAPSVRRAAEALNAGNRVLSDVQRSQLARIQGDVR